MLLTCRRQQRSFCLTEIKRGNQTTQTRSNPWYVPSKPVCSRGLAHFENISMHFPNCQAQCDTNSNMHPRPSWLVHTCDRINQGHVHTRSEEGHRVQYECSYLEEKEGMRGEGWSTWQVVMVWVGEVWGRLGPDEETVRLWREKDKLNSTWSQILALY